MLGPWQDKMIFHCVRLNPLTAAAYQDQEIQLKQPGATLQGWRLEVPDAPSDQVLVYFGGNAEDITLNFSQVARLGARKVYFFNYRGYGRSQGKPSQAALYADALRIHDFLVGEQGIDPERLVLLGRSLGAAVATYLAAHRPVSKVVLVTPFDSILALAQQLFPWLPVRWLLRHPFPSADYAPNIQTPVLMVVAAQDDVVPNANSLVLFEHWAGPKQLYRIEGAGHNDLHLNNAYYETIASFISGIP